MSQVPIPMSSYGSHEAQLEVAVLGLNKAFYLQTQRFLIEADAGVQVGYVQVGVIENKLHCIRLRFIFQRTARSQ